MSRFLFASPNAPGMGGAATACYELYARVRAGGHDAQLVNLIDERSAERFASELGPGAGNPLALPDVRDCRVSQDPNEPQHGLEALVREVDPTVVIAFGHRATWLCKTAAPGRRTILVTGTCRQAQDHVTSGRAPDAVTLSRDLASGRLTARLLHGEEARAMNACDLIITHSDLTLSMVERFYPGHAGKIYPRVVSFAEWLCDRATPYEGNARPFGERDIDVCFVAVNWARREKNYPWVEEIAGRLPGAAIHVVGDVPRTIPGVTHHGFLPAAEVLCGLLGRTRCVASVSTIDAAPGVLYEASVMGCNVVASRNCGNWELCHPDLLVDPFDAGGFTATIARALTKQYADNLAMILSRASYEDFIATIEAFARPFEPVAA